ncbi:hypothetical protein NLJ89_g7410 [Agrocybe chaxingu]|uniref:Uncharacterized protein n=1 Tax=Agrocybe chaxingu TaxID=84603 RepID=A0A9W8JXE5_9AGAR|nr:hypothetical protein NLJ89_g7410 [Agrocybe chaxingu]
MSPPDTAPPKDLYHHFIPRFILRQFHVSPVRPHQLRPHVEAEWSLWRGSKKGAESVFYYDLATGSLDVRPLSKVYGQINLYRDEKDPTNVDYLEGKLAELERDTSGVIRSIHCGIPQRCFSLSRMELATLRKFIFLMHYRNDAHSSVYFNEKTRHNAPLANWIKKFKEARQLETEVDVWLTGLKYYLETPHHTMVAVGEGLRERYGDQPISEMLRRRFEPAIEEWYAMDYESLANYFFLGVWEAADDTEFVLGSNGLGLWEGLIYGNPGAHRLYVVSPRVALVLRRTFLHHPHSNDPSVLYSCLADVPIAQPTTEYADRTILERIKDADPWIKKSAFDAYRATPKAQEDRFTFRITKLTSAQTYAVNEVIMMNANLRHNGSLTYASSKAMLTTLEAYMSSHNTFMGGKRQLFQPLLRKLQALKSENFSRDALIKPSKVKKLKADAPPSPVDHVDSCTDADHQLSIFLQFTVKGNVTFPSLYNRAFLLLRMATDRPLANPISDRVRGIRDTAISRLCSFLDPPLPIFNSPNSYPSSDELVETLPREESELFFSLIGHLVDQLDVGRHSNDILANLIYEAGIIAVALWLTKERPDVLVDLLHPWVSIFG